MLKNVNDLANQDFDKGLVTVPNLFKVDESSSPDCMDVKINFDGSIEKRKGSIIQNATSIGGTASTGFSFGSGVLTNNLVAYWKMDEDSEGREDQVGSSDLDSINNALSAEGIKGKAAVFVVSDSQGLRADTNDSLETGDVDFFFNTWIYLNSTGLNQTILSKRDQAGVDSSTLLLLHYTGSSGAQTFTDSSVYNFGLGNTQGTTTLEPVSISNTEAKINITSGKFERGVLGGNFDSNSLWVEGSPSEFNIGAGDFTIEAWVYLTTDSESCAIYQQMANDGSNTYTGLNLAFETAGGNTSGVAHLTGAVQNGGVPPFIIGMTASILVTTGSWVNCAWQKSGGVYDFWINGTHAGVYTTTVTALANKTYYPIIGSFTNAQAEAHFGGMDGWMDEFRFSNIARYSSESDFTLKTKEFGVAENLEYMLSVDSNDNAIFEVSSSGTAFDGSVTASSIGALDTATWYNIIPWHDTGNTLGISVNLSVNTSAYTSGVRAGSASFVVGAASDGTTGNSSGLVDFSDMRIDETGLWKRIPTDNDRESLYNSGAGNTYDAGFSGFTWGSFDFGASDKRWVCFAAGTGLYASSDLGVNFTEFGTSQTATYTNFERSKSVLIITSDGYDPVLRWDGSGGTHAVLMNNSAPTTKFSINHQGFLILLNSDERKRIFAYEDENTQLTGDWADNFDLPSSEDDEITAAFVLGKNLYVSTRFKIFRVSFVGGNPDWSFSDVKSWGFVPRTARKITLKDIGEVVVGMSWDRRIRLFDGADDKIVSDNVENDNKMCDFALEKVSYAGSGLEVSHAVVDDNEQIYRLNVAIGLNSTETTHAINLDSRDLHFYPYQNQRFQTMVMAESNNQRFLLAGDRSGTIHLMNSGNLDSGVTPIDEHFDSSFAFDKSPGEVRKQHKANLFFSVKGADGSPIKYQDRIDFNDEFKDRVTFSLDSSNKVLIKQSHEIPTTNNVYQYRITTEAGTGNTWQLNRVDLYGKTFGIGQNP